MPELLASSARRAAGSSLGGGGPVSLLARAFSTGSGRVSALARTGPRNHPLSAVPHSRGKLVIISEDLRGVGNGLPASAIAAFFSIAYQSVSSCPRPLSPLSGF